MTKKKSLTFDELAEFIASDYTLDIFPDIVWPIDCRFPKAKQAWLAERLAKQYEDFLLGPKEEISDELAPVEDVE